MGCGASSPAAVEPSLAAGSGPVPNETAREVGGGGGGAPAAAAEPAAAVPAPAAPAVARVRLPFSPDDYLAWSAEWYRVTRALAYTLHGTELPEAEANLSAEELAGVTQQFEQLKVPSAAFRRTSTAFRRTFAALSPPSLSHCPFTALSFTALSLCRHVSPSPRTFRCCGAAGGCR